MKALGDILGRDPGIQSSHRRPQGSEKNNNNKVFFLRRFAACRQKFGRCIRFYFLGEVCY